MELQHTNVKLFVDPATPVDLAALIPTFHRWIQEGGTDELLLDVADYRHVPEGPGVLLMGHEADYALDESEGRRGLLYNLKAKAPGSNRDRLRQALKAAVAAALRLEGDASLKGLRFSRQELRVVANDRLLTPNTAENYAALEAELGALLEQVMPGSEPRFEHVGEARERLSIAVYTAKPFEPAAVLAALQA